MKEKIAIISFILLLAAGFFMHPHSTGYAVYTPRPDLVVEKILTHGVDTSTNDFFVYYYIKNNGNTIKKGTEISTRVFVWYTKPPVTSESSSGSISTAEILVEEASATYILNEDLKTGKRVLVASPAVPILLSTVRFFEKYHIKNRITVELDTSKSLSESNEKNNKLRKWYYMQKLDEPAEKALLPE